MVEKLQKIWIDGEMVEWDDANVHILTHSLHYGVAAFEGIRAYKRANGQTYVFRLREHIDRLFDTCKLALLQPKFTREQISQACIETLRANGMSEGYLRPLIFLGEGAMGIYAPDNPVRTSVIAGSGGRTSAKKRSRTGSAARSPRSRATTSTSASRRRR